MGASCSSEQGYDFCGPSRPRSQPNALGQQRPADASKTANDDINTVTGNPQTEYDFDNGTVPSRLAQTDIGSKWPYRTSTIKHTKVKIERILWGRLKAGEGQDTFKANIKRESAGMRGGTATRCFHILRGIAPPGDDACRRAEGRIHTPQEYLQAMGETRTDSHVKQAGDGEKAKEARGAEQKAAVQTDNTLTVGDTNADIQSLRPADHKQTMPQNGNMVDFEMQIGTGPSSLDPFPSQNKNENIPPGLYEQVAQECMAMNKHAIAILRSDMDAWLKANIMCYDIRHTDTTIESRIRLGKGEIAFSTPEKIVINQLLVPYPIPGHAYFPISDSKLNHGKGETLTLYQLQDHLRRVIAMEVKAGASKEASKHAFFKEFAPYFEYTLGIFDDGKQLENRLWFLQLMEKFGSSVPEEELAKWDEKMSGVYGIGDEARTPEVASSWRAAPSEMKSLSEWISIIEGEQDSGSKATASWRQLLVADGVVNSHGAE